MARTIERAPQMFGRRLVDEGIITQDQLNRCTRAALEVGSSDAPKLTLELVLEPAEFLRLMREAH